MATYEEQIFPGFADELMFSAQGCRANRPPSPGSEAARAITVGSGTQCSMLLAKSSPLGAFSKILLASSHWTNSEEYSYVWNRLDTRFALSAFQLTPLGPSTEDNGSSLLPTPIRKDAEEGSGRGHHLNPAADMKAGIRLKEAVVRLWRTPNTFDSLEVKSQEALDHEREATHSGIEPNNLRDQIAVRAGLRLWRTPSVSDVLGGGQNGEKRLDAGHMMKLSDQAKTLKLWPTPRKEGYDAQGKGHGDLQYEVKAKLWPTPTVQDGANNAGLSQMERNSLSLNALAGGSLNPEFVEALMMFPIGHTRLQPNESPIAPPDSKHSEIQCRPPASLPVLRSDRPGWRAQNQPQGQACE